MCGLDLRAHDAGDGAAVGVILLLGAIVVGSGLLGGVPLLAAALGARHALAGGDGAARVLMMRPAKAALVALQFRHRSSEMGL